MLATCENIQVWTGGRHSSFVPLPVVQPRRRCTDNLDHRKPDLFPSPHPPAQLDSGSARRTLAVQDGPQTQDSLLECRDRADAGRGASFVALDRQPRRSAHPLLREGCCRGRARMNPDSFSYSRSRSQTRRPPRRALTERLPRRSRTLSLSTRCSSSCTRPSRQPSFSARSPSSSPTRRTTSRPCAPTTISTLPRACRRC